MHCVLALSMPSQEAAGITSLSKAVSNESNRTRLRVTLARYYINQQKTEQALANLYDSTNKNDKAVEQLLAAAVITSDAIGPLPAAVITSDAIGPLLQQAGQLYASNHSVEEVQQWLGSAAETRPPLAPNANVLSALIDIQEGDVQQARTILELIANEDDPIGNRTYGHLLATDAVISAQAFGIAAAIASHCHTTRQR
jgi:lipopolysaccharide biosynthesis regulator YciM